MTASAYSWCSKSVRRVFAALLGASLAGTAWGEELSSTTQVHGFAGQGFILTSDNNFFGSSDNNGSFDFTEVGLNGSVRPLSKLQLSAQALSRRAGEGEDGDLRLDYGFLDYSFVSNESGGVGFRLGRIKNPYGLYGETRAVAFTRPSIFLPQSIYFDRTRNLALSSDGGHVYGEYRSDFGDITLQAGEVWLIVNDINTEMAFLGRDMAGELNSGRSFIGRLMYEKEGGKIRLALTGARANVDYVPGTSDILKAGAINFIPSIFSAQYNTEQWNLTTEYAVRRFKYQDFGSAIPNMDFSGESYYIQGGYRVGTWWEAMARYDVYYVDRNDRNGSQYAAAKPGRVAYSRYAKDWTFGLRWDATRWLMLRAEYHVVEGTGWLPLQDNPDPLSTRKYWDMFALLASLRF